jgi:hypothetical protein
MSVDSFVERMRARQEDLFSSTVTITRPTGTVNVGDDLVASPTTATAVYAGVALVRPEAPGEVQAGEQLEHLARHLVKVPANTDVRIGDTVTVDASDHDEQLVGVALVVVDSVLDEWSISRRLTCEQQRG